MTFHSESYLPALKIDRQGKRRVNYQAIAILALPLFLDSAIADLVGWVDDRKPNTLGAKIKYGMIDVR